MQKIQLGKSLSEGFIFYAISTLTIAIQFLFYLIHSPRLAMMDVGGWMFYITAACSHAALWALIPYIISLIAAITSGAIKPPPSHTLFLYHYSIYLLT